MNSLAPTMGIKLWSHQAHPQHMSCSRQCRKTIQLERYPEFPSLVVYISFHPFYSFIYSFSIEMLLTEGWGTRLLTIFINNEAISLWLFQPHGFSGFHCGFSDYVDVAYGTKWVRGNTDLAFLVPWLTKIKGLSIRAWHRETNTEYNFLCDLRLVHLGED